MPRKKKEDSNASIEITKEKTKIRGGKEFPRCQEILKSGLQCDRIQITIKGKNIGYCRVHIKNYPKLMTKFIEEKSKLCKKPGSSQPSENNENFSLYSTKILTRFGVDIKKAIRHASQVNDMTDLIIVSESYLNFLLEKYSEKELKQGTHKIAILIDTINKMKKNYNDIKFAEKNSILVSDFKLILFSILRLALQHIDSEEEQHKFLDKFGEISKTWNSLSAALQTNRELVFETIGKSSIDTKIVYPGENNE